MKICLNETVNYRDSNEKYWTSWISLIMCKVLFYYIIAIDASLIEKLYPHIEFLKTIKVNQTSKMLSESSFHDTSSNKHFI